MLSVPKWDESNMGRVNFETFLKILSTINRMNNFKAEKSPSGKTTKGNEPYAKRLCLDTAKRKWVEVPGSSYFAQSRFFQLSPELKLGNRVLRTPIEKILSNNPGLLISSKVSWLEVQLD